MKLVLLSFLAIVLFSCGGGKVIAVVKVKVADKDGNELNNCSVEFFHGKKSKYIYSFNKDIVFDASYYPDLEKGDAFLEFKCLGYEEVHKVTINPADFRWKDASDIKDLGVFTYENLLNPE